MLENTADKTRYTRADGWISLLLAFVLAAICLLSLRSDTTWGDDHAAYISYGIAIAEGEVEEQAVRNYTLHPTPLPDEAEGAVYYVWGYPILLAAVYRLAGFDRTDYHTVLYYKLPLVLALGLGGAVLYLFYRRRFSRTASALLALAICGTGRIAGRVDSSPDTDILFFSLAVSVYLFTELFLETENPRSRCLRGCALGALIWYSCETRLNGLVFLPFLLFSHVLWLSRKKASRAPRTAAAVISHLLPYLVFALGRMVSPFLLPAATSNASDFTRSSLLSFAKMGFYNLRDTVSWLGSLILRLDRTFPKPLFYLLGGAILALALWGIRRRGGRENLPYTVLLAGSALGVCALPYRQGVRYLFYVLPLLCMFAVFGGEDLLSRRKAGLPRLPLRMKKAAAALLLVWTLFPLGQYALRGPDWVSYATPYDPEAVEIWQVIREQTPEDCRIYFAKPRMLYLNTERMGYTDGNGRDMEEADYALITVSFPPTGAERRCLEESFVPVYENSAFTLYAHR